MPGLSCSNARVPLAINLELRRGRHGASARVELHERAGGTVALVEVRGWIERVALGRLARILEDLALADVCRLLLDCSLLRHIDVRLVAPLVESLGRFTSDHGTVVVCGLSHQLSHRLRAAAPASGFSCWPSAAELLASPFAFERAREWAT